MAADTVTEGIKARGRRIRQSDPNKVKSDPGNPYRSGSRAAVMFEALVRPNDHRGKPKVDAEGNALGVGQARMRDVIGWIVEKARRTSGTEDDRAAIRRDIENHVSDGIKSAEDVQYKLRMQRRQNPADALDNVVTITHVRAGKGHDWVTLNRWLKQHAE